MLDFSFLKLENAYTLLLCNPHSPSIEHKGVTRQGLLCPQCRKPNSDSEYPQQSKSLFAGRQARRTGSSCSKDPNSPMAYR